MEFVSGNSDHQMTTTVALEFTPKLTNAGGPRPQDPKDPLSHLVVQDYPGGQSPRTVSKEIAKTLNISTRTVHRVLNQNNQQNQKFVLELKNQNIIKKSQLISMRN